MARRRKHEIRLSGIDHTPVAEKAGADIGGRPAQDRAGVRRKNMKRKAISKLIGAGLTVAFFALVRPSSVPGMGITSAFSIVMYEVLSGFAHDIIGEHYIDVPREINEKHGLRNWAKTKVGA